VDRRLRFQPRIRDIIRERVDLEDTILGGESASWRRWPARARTSIASSRAGELPRGDARLGLDTSSPSLAAMSGKLDSAQARIAELADENARLKERIRTP